MQVLCLRVLSAGSNNDFLAGPVALAMLNNRKVDTLPLSSKSFPLPTVTQAFPAQIDQAVGGAVEDGSVPLVCGGYDSKGTRKSECYKYSHETHIWTLSGRMTEAKSQHAASIHPDLGLIITGGHTGGRVLTTVESTTDGKHFSKSLPAMPIPNYVHCQVTVGSNTIMVFGGCRSGNCQADVALKLNIAEKRWKKLPALPTGRHAPACGVVEERGTPKRVVVSGGWRASKILTTVEVLQLSTLKWSTGHPLPQKLFYHRSVQFRNTFFILGGHNGSSNLNTIYRFESETGRWTLLSYKLSTRARGITAFAVNRRAFKGSQ